jgi:Protein of unknown function (DUF3306)
MTEPENSAKNFLRRWSKRKRIAETSRLRATARQRIDSDADTDAKATSPTSLHDDSQQPTFDLASLPPIESITATSDIRPFLAPGVPEQLTRAALRRLWAIDPMIRNFVGLAENQWDFTKPDSLPGFGSLEFTPALRRLVASLINDASPSNTPLQKAARQEQITRTAAQTLPPATPTATSPSTLSTQQSLGSDDLAATDGQNLNRVTAPHRDDDVATQNSSENKNSSETNASLQPAPRKHGGALPR